MTMTRAELARAMHGIAIRLENDSSFYATFRKAVDQKLSSSTLRQHIFKVCTAKEEGVLREADNLHSCYRAYAGREYLLRYFLMTWGLTDPRPHENERRDYPAFEFWLDREQWPDQIRASEALASQPAPNPDPTPTSKEQPIMLQITTKTLINGEDIAKKSDGDLFDAIAQAEAEIVKLEAIKTKPKALLAKIDELHAGIAALVTHMDARA